MIGSWAGIGSSMVMFLAGWGRPRPWHTCDGGTASAISTSEVAAGVFSVVSHCFCFVLVQRHLVRGLVLTADGE
ncbi:hypothetical protein ACWDWU_16165 [Streptomyces sp. NPDC003442]